MRTVVITGVSSGIGAHLALLLLQREYRVIGTVRSGTPAHPDLRSHPLFQQISMDLGDEASITAAFSQIKILTREHPLYALINNAGIAVPGPLTHLPIEKLKQQFQINVFGWVKAVQEAFPLLRESGPGTRIINISSVSGRFASPFLGAYAGSKYATEGLTDSLRRELRLFGIKVVLIQPGPLKTLIWEKNLGVGSDFSESPYQSYMEHAADTIRQTEKNALPLHHLNAPVIHALEAPSPKTRYLIHKNPYRLRILATFLPASWVDHLVHKNLTSGSRKIRPV